MSRFAASTGPLLAPVLWWAMISVRQRRSILANRRSSGPTRQRCTSQSHRRGGSCSPRRTRRGPTRSRPTSGRCASSSSPTATTPTTLPSPERSPATSAGATPTPASPGSWKPNADSAPESGANNNAPGDTRAGQRHSARTFVVRALAVPLWRSPAQQLGADPERDELAGGEEQAGGDDEEAHHPHVGAQLRPAVRG